MTRLWLLIGLTCLALSGLLALLLAISRMPWLAAWFSDPLFFRRTLVVHVDLGVTVWFTAFPLALSYYCTSRFHIEDQAKKLSNALPAFASILSILGILLFALDGMAGSATPLLSNYIPMISSPGFAAGIALYFLGIALQFAYLLLIVWPKMPQFWLKPALQVGTSFMLLAFITLLADTLRTDRGLLEAAFYEVAFWGGGHLLQNASAIFMVISWCLLLGRSQDDELNPLLSVRQVRWLSAWLGLPLVGGATLLFLGPNFSFQGSWMSNDLSFHSRDLYTQLMRFGIFPPVLVLLGLLLPQVKIQLRKFTWGSSQHTLLLAFLLSSGMILFGFAYGFTIRGQDLRIPGHYHASLGAVSLAYTSLSLCLAASVGWVHEAQALSSRLARAFIWNYGLGQWMHATGLLTAGFLGLSRKVYGTEQKVTHALAPMAMGFMGLGSLVAVIGAALLFITLYRFRIEKVRSNSQVTPLQEVK